MDYELAPYLERIRQWNDQLALDSVRPNPYGLNNYVLILNDEWVFRFPRSAESRETLYREAELLGVLRPSVDVAVPAFTLEPGQDFVVYPLVPGRPVYNHDLARWPEAERRSFARAIGRFLDQLHNIPSAALVPVVGTPQPDATDLWAQRLAVVRAELYPYLWADQKAWVEDLFAPVVAGQVAMSGYTPCLIHSDLAGYHLLAGPRTGDLTGVLDFGSAGWGDPAADLATLINGYGESFVALMGDAYPLTDDLLDRARVRAQYLELEWALKGVRRSDPEWFLVHLGRARDIGPLAGRPAAA